MKARASPIARIWLLPIVRVHQVWEHLFVSIRFRALKHRNFQLFFAGQLISLIGTWMQSAAQLWLVYKMTNSPALLGVFGFASQIPILFLAPVGGFVGDRYNRHRGVIWTQTAALILS